MYLIAIKNVFLLFHLMLFKYLIYLMSFKRCCRTALSIEICLQSKLSKYLFIYYEYLDVLLLRI